MRDEIEKLTKEAIALLQKEKVFPKFETSEIKVEHPKEKIHGDYSTNVAMEIGKKARKKPMEIAEQLKSQISKLKTDLFEKIEVAEPGFINFFLTREHLVGELNRICKEKQKYGSAKIGKGKTVIIDYSSPNIAKPFGIGHLRSTIIGQALYNIYKFLGWRCIGDNHLGDWGTQFGKLIYQIRKEKLAGKLEKEKDSILKALTIEELERLYVSFHQEAEEYPEIEEEARLWFKKLEEGDEKAKKIWQACVNISLEEFDRVYKLLGVKIDYTLGESFYQGMLKKVIDEAIKKKIATKSQGALIIKYPQEKLPPAMILKSDGATTYLTRDLATINYRFKKWKSDLIIYEVGVDQSLHFNQLFWAVELLGWAKREKFFHVAHGLIRFKEGKLSTRKGRTIHLEEVLKEAVKRARKIIEQSETGRGLSKEEKEKVGEAVGIGAVKYNDLSQHYSRDIIFDWDKILNLKGNSGPYLQYTFARCQSVLQKAKYKIKDEKIRSIDLNKEEEDILRIIYKFPEVIEEAAGNFSPNLICNFIFDLSQRYNLFYALHPIIKAKTSELKVFRLALTAAIAQVLKNALSLLGILTPERM